ncbi:putative phospholipase B-like 2 [Liolophura sinensis]|uniref:putative phospholipase B-like 2 n=1 Tax=Liolophura sinensis TaxID=3198878 RepID=UPI00315991DE
MAERQTESIAENMYIQWNIIIVLTVLISGCPQVCADEIYVLYNPVSRSFTASQGKLDVYVAHAVFNNTIQETGFSSLEIQTSGSYPDDIQAYAAGWAEGYLTKNLISDHWANTAHGYCSSPPTPYCRRLRIFLEQNLRWMKNAIEKNVESPYWHQVSLFLIQVNGMTDGYRNTTSPPTFTVADPLGLLFLQIQDDVYDLENVLHKENMNHIFGGEKCSALIKLLPGNEDILVAHDTWSSYKTMLRIIKKYDLSFGANTRSGVIPGKAVSFSSYPGTLISTDDFYIMSSGLVSLETTIDNDNSTLWQHVKSSGQVLEAIRTVVANRLSNTARDWANTFAKFNSGTYNNEWMIVDYKEFHPHRPLPDRGVLIVLEQIPGFVEYEDMTQWLKVNSYWASYNLPFFPDVYNMSGKEALREKHGDFFSYSNSPRARIFRRDQGKVVDVHSMMKLMRYNDFQHDPLSRCQCEPPYSGDNSISARNDLNPANGTYPLRALGSSAFGGIDMKLTNYAMSQMMEMIVISGPTFDQQPPFQWSTSQFSNVSHRGQPDLFKFDPVHVSWGV